MKTTWAQVLAWRLRRQYLAPHADVGATAIVARTCGVQAQVASAAELAIALRHNDPEPAALERGLNERTLLKTWGPRGTLHVFPPRQARSFLALMRATRTWEKPAWQRAFGATPADIAALSDAVSQLLDGETLTRDELVAALAADERFAGIEEQLRSGWSALLKPLAWQGVICHGPSRGNNVTFTNPHGRFDDWSVPVEPDEVAGEAIAAYLGAYGPATPQAFDAWLSRGNTKLKTLRGWFASMGDSLTEIDIEGESGYFLSALVDELAATPPSDSVRLLGAFDQYVLGPGTKDTRLLASEHRAKVSRAGGWISPVVVAGGRIVGVWKWRDNAVTVTLFSGADTPSRAALRVEAERVGRVSAREGVSLAFE